MIAATLEDLAAGYQAMADELKRRAECARAERREWIDQAGSPLGARRHIAAVRRRIAAGDPSAARPDARRHLLSAAALAEELARASAKPAKGKPRSNAVVAPVLTMTDRLEQVKRSVAK